jgi:hypothetical protein
LPNELEAVFSVYSRFASRNILFALLEQSMGLPQIEWIEPKKPNYLKNWGLVLTKTTSGSLLLPTIPYS